MVKRGFILVSIILIQISAFAQSRVPGFDRPTTSELTIKITLDDNSYPTMPLRVQLLNGTRTPVAEAFTRDNGSAQFGRLTPGSYLVHVTGIDIEDTTSPLFSISPRESNHNEFLTVYRRATASAGSTTAGPISASALNIPEKARKEFDKGMESIDKKNLPDADTHFAKALTAYPRHAAALNARGVVAMHMEKPTEAEDFFRKSIEADAQFSPAYVNLAKLMIAQKKEGAGEDLLNKSLSQNPRDPSALSVLANLYLTTGRLDDAVLNARKIHALPHAEYSVGHLIAGIALERKRLDLEAAAEYRQFLEESPNSNSADRVKAQLDAIAKRVH